MNRNIYFALGAVVVLFVAALFLGMDPKPAALIGGLFLGNIANLRAPLGGTGGGTLRFTNATGADLASGAFAIVGDRKGFVLEATANGAEGVLIHQTDSQGYEANKAAVAVAEGEDAFVITATSLVTNDGAAGANPRVGYFAEPAAAGTAKVRVVLDAGLQTV